MSNGVQLTLMVGSTIPLPVPREVVEALVEAQVTTTAGQASGFQLTFTLSSRSPLHTIFILAGSTLLPLLRVIIIATTNATPIVLFDGVVTHQQVTPGERPGESRLTVTGSDLTQVMDYLDFSGFEFPAMSPELRVALILAKYSVFGIVPVIIPSISSETPSPTERIPTQQGTDLAYIKSLASDAGYVFYIEPGPLPGTSTAYWGPEIKLGIPQPALNTDMDAYTNTESVNFSFNADSVEVPIVYIQNPETKVPIPIPIPDISPLNPPLGIVEPLPKRTVQLGETAKLSPVSAIMIGMARAAKSYEAVSCSGSLDVVRYGHILRARQLVGVRGAGVVFDGLYYVQSVHHSLKLGQYKQNFTLTRNRLVSNVPVVIP